MSWEKSVMIFRGAKTCSYSCSKLIVFCSLEKFQDECNGYGFDWCLLRWYQYCGRKCCCLMNWVYCYPGSELLITGSWTRSHQHVQRCCSGIYFYPVPLTCFYKCLHPLEYNYLKKCLREVPRFYYPRCLKNLRKRNKLVWGIYGRETVR
jgi:hypothetical protein